MAVKVMHVSPITPSTHTCTCKCIQICHLPFRFPKQARTGASAVHTVVGVHKKNHRADNIYI